MLQELLNKHCLDPKNPQKVYDLAEEYDRIKNGAMAISLYLKAADLTQDRLLQYKAMIQIGRCYNRQGNRGYTVEGAYMDAAAIFPERPEALYYLSRFYEDRQAWKQSYYFATVGMKAHHFDDIGLEYPGIKHMAFQKAMAKWYITGTQQGRREMFDFYGKTYIEDDPDFKWKVHKLMTQVGFPDVLQFQHEDKHRFKYPFPGYETIDRNYSKHMQDMFVLACLNGKRNGTYLEIGSGDPIIHSNTALLEKDFGWKGISIDTKPALCYKFREERLNTIINADARQIGYSDLFDKHCVNHHTDYLQIDCDDASLDTLKRLPLETHKFGVITFEHDAYRSGPKRRDEARSILKEHGYILMVNDLAMNELYSYEDWFVHPDIVDIDPLMRTKGADVNFVWDYFMEELTEENERVL